MHHDLLALNPLIEEVFRLAEIDLRASAQTLVLDLAPGLSRFRGDGVLVQQVVMNLIRNSVEAMRNADYAGAVRVRTCKGESGVLEIHVADEGPGLMPEVEARLFDPFVTTKDDGMGLGLSICQSIMQLHGGDLSYRQSPDGGAEFVARLPAVAGSQGADDS